MDNQEKRIEDFKIKITNGENINVTKDSMNRVSLMWEIFRQNSEVAKFLIDNGADLTITDTLGKRAYHWALDNDNPKLAEYIKSKEPNKFHDLDLKIAQFKEFNCPQSMIDFFMQKDNSIETEFGTLNFHYITDVFDFNYARALYGYKEVQKDIFEYDNHDFLGLTLEFERFPDFMLLWSKDLKTICHYDYEHSELFSLCTWEEFQTNMIEKINNLLNYNDVGKHIGDYMSVCDANGDILKGDIYWEDL